MEKPPLEGAVIEPPLLTGQGTLALEVGFLLGCCKNPKHSNEPSGPRVTAPSCPAVPSLSLFLRMGSFYKVKTKKGCYKVKTSQNYTVKTPLFPLGIGSSVRCLEPLLDRACARKPMATRGSSRLFFGREKSRLIHAPWAFRGGGGLELDQPLKTRFLCRIQQSTCGFLENHLPFFVVLGAPVCW